MVVSINYDALERTQKKILDTATGTWGVEQYGNSLNSNVAGMLSEEYLSAWEPYGGTYITNAYGSLNNKQVALNQKSTLLKGTAGTIGKYIEFAKETDKDVANDFQARIENHVDYSGVGGWFLSFWDMLYGLDINLRNSNPLTRRAYEGQKKVAGWASYAWGNVENWFQYGDGKYVCNIVSALSSAELAILGAIGAFLAIPWSGGSSSYVAATCLVAAASSVSAAYEAFDSCFSIYYNSKAIDLNDTNPGLAMYSGKKDSFTEWVNRTDFGSWNGFMGQQVSGRAFSGGVADVINLFGGAALSLFGTGTTFSFTPETAWSNLKGMFGIKTETTSSILYKDASSRLTIWDDRYSNKIPDFEMPEQITGVHAQYGYWDIRARAYPGDHNVTIHSMQRKVGYTVDEIATGYGAVTWESYNMQATQNRYFIDYHDAFKPYNPMMELDGQIPTQNLYSFFHSEEKVNGFKSVTSKIASGCRFAKASADVASGEKDVAEGVVDYKWTETRFGYMWDTYVWTYEDGKGYLGGTSGKEIVEDFEEWVGSWKNN